MIDRAFEGMKIVRTAMVALLVVGISGGAAHAAEDADISSPDAGEILTGMGAFLGAAKAFSVTVDGSYDALQEDGTHLEFAGRRDITLTRPARLRVASYESDGTLELLTFDGNTLSLVRPAEKIYAQTDFAGSIDDAVVHFVGELGLRLPLAMLLLARLPEELDRRVISIAYVERALLSGVPAHHLVATTETVDFQIWVKDGDQPVPLRVNIRYREAAGQPTFRANLTDWNFAPAIDEATFRVALPRDARRVAFFNQVEILASHTEEEQP
ncbi:MAG: DUF2092 domain-containing protein [Gammaproteobacteria bacterium]